MTVPAPPLEMLWEAHDPGAVLTARFGHEDGAALVDWLAGVLDEQWDLRLESCERIVMSDTNALVWLGTSAGPVVAKWSVAAERFPRLAALARLTAWLDGQGLPVSAPVATPDGALQVEVDGVSLGLQREVAGALLDADDPVQVHAVGAAVARLHDALADYPEADRLAELVAPPAPSPAALLAGWLDDAPAHVPAAARDALRALVDAASSDALPTQLVHGDVRSANVLCAGQEVVAVIDFEEIRLDTPVAELARAAVLLGTRFRDWAPVSPDVRAQLLVGYQSVRALTPAEASWWDALVLWHSWRMVPSGDDPAGWGAAATAVSAAVGRPGPRPTPGWGPR